MKHTKMLWTKALVVLAVLLLTAFAFGAVVSATEAVTYKVEFYNSIGDDLPVYVAEEVSLDTEIKKIVADGNVVSLLLNNSNRTNIYLSFAQGIDSDDWSEDDRTSFMFTLHGNSNSLKLEDYLDYLQRYDKDAYDEAIESKILALYSGVYVIFRDNDGEMIKRGVYPNGAVSTSDIAPEDFRPTKWVFYSWIDNVYVDHDMTALLVEGKNSEYEFDPAYQITFAADGKQIEQGYFVADGDDYMPLFEEPLVPNKIGYYGKWQPYTLSANNIVVNAQYSGKAYRVYFDANGGEGEMDAQLLTYGKAKALSENLLTRDGYTFAGWNTEADGSGDPYVDGEVVKNLTTLANITLYAQWTKDAPKVYTATFMAGGTVVGTVTFEEGATALSDVPSIPVRTGYTGAWDAYTLADKDLTIHATYTPNDYVIQFNANGGEGNMKNVLATFDAEAILSDCDFTREGYVFTGWNTMADGTGISFAAGAAVKNLTGENSITLFAEWEEDTTADETTTAEETTTAAPAEEEKSNVGLIVGVSVVAGLAVIGGVVGYLIYKKKKNGAEKE